MHTAKAGMDASVVAYKHEFARKLLMESSTSTCACARTPSLSVAGTNRKASRRANSQREWPRWGRPFAPAAVSAKSCPLTKPAS